MNELLSILIAETEKADREATAHFCKPDPKDCPRCTPVEEKK